MTSSQRGVQKPCNYYFCVSACIYFPSFLFSFTLQHSSTWGKCNCILLPAIIPADRPHALFMLSNMACWIFKLEGILRSGSGRCGNYLLHKMHERVWTHLCVFGVCVCMYFACLSISEPCCICGGSVSVISQVGLKLTSLFAALNLHDIYTWKQMAARPHSCSSVIRSLFS